MIDCEHGKRSHNDGYRDGDRTIEGSLVARQPTQPAKKFIH
jgi:hypothetical protein